MKKRIALLLLLIFLFAAGCSSQKTELPEESAAPEESAVVGIANPWTKYDSLADAEAQAGFAFPQPNWADDYDSVVYRVTEGIIEVIYEQDGGQRVTLRKGADETDISGDYNAYTFTGTSEDVQTGRVIEIKGESAQLCSAATWTEDGHFYAFFCDLPLEIDRVIDLVHSVIGAHG